ncbi:MAG: SH3 domain-containing protein [Sphingomicrobium sp.]
MADAALAGQVIASHYADPVECRINAGAALRDRPAGDAVLIRRLDQGEPFAVLDSTLGWAWGYAGSERRVGYVESTKIGR